MGYSKQQIIDQVTTGNKYLNICRKLLKGNSLYKDLYQDLTLALLEVPEEKFLKIECPDCYIYRILQSLVYYNRLQNRYYSKLDKEEMKVMEAAPYNYSVDVRAARAQSVINKLPYHDKLILNKWIEGSSDRRIAGNKNVPRYFVTRKIKELTTKVRQQVKMQELDHPIKMLMVIQPQKTALQYHRQYMPHERLLKTSGKDFNISYTSEVIEGEASIDGFSDEQLKDFQIVYFLRQVSFNKDKVDPTIERLHRLGCKVVLDIDDYWHLPQDHHWYQMYKEKKVAESITSTLKQVDHVITTTKYFAQQIAKYNKNVTVLPNCINPDAKQFESREIESQRIRFGWIGGVFHQPDIEMIDECFNKLNQVYGDKETKDKVQLCVGGFSCNYEYKEIEKTFTANYSFRHTDQTYYNYLQQCTPTMEHISYDKPYRRLWGRDIETYGELYNEIEVALVPLQDNTFNRCKSELKIVEAGWMKKAVICSNITPYKEWIQNGVNGITVNPNRNNIDWYLAIKKLSANPSMVDDMAAALHETIATHFDMDRHNCVRSDLYKSLI